MPSKQNPNIKLLPDTKNLLQSMKRNPNDTFDNVIKSVINSAIATSTAKRKEDFPIGLGSGTDTFDAWTHTLGWISDTLKKMPTNGNYATTPSMRELSYDVDPLINGIITPFLKNIILNDHIIETKDNKKYAAMIDDINKYLKDIKFMKALRDDFEDLAIKHGHSYRRKDYEDGKEGYIKKLQRLEARAMVTYEDPFDSDITLYHQRIKAKDVFSTNTLTQSDEINSWWVPGGLPINQDTNYYANGAKEKWEEYAVKYFIDETTRLRVGDSKDIIAMHKVRPGKNAPIDAAIQAIWEKRMTMANLPNVIMAVVMPFVQIQHGKLIETTDEQGRKVLVSSLPQPPPAGMATTDPTGYTDMETRYQAYLASAKANVENFNRWRLEGGLFATGPDVEVKVIESASTIAPAFVREVFNQYNEEICQTFGLPYSMLTAKGTELATARTLQDLVNTVYAGERLMYNDWGDIIIEERFAGQKWSYEIEDKYGKKESGEYTFEETGVQFKLSNGDVTDALKVAQTRLVNFEAAEKAKVIGATKADIQAFFSEIGEGDTWDFENYDAKIQAENPVSTGGGANIPSLPSSVKPPSISEQIESTISAKEKIDIDAPEIIPKNIDKKMANELVEAWAMMEEEFKEIDLDIEKK